MSDTDATRARRDVVAEVDEIIEYVINGNMQSMPYDVYLELFDAVDGLGVEIEKIQSENAKLRQLVTDMWQAWWACDNEKCPRYEKRCDTEKFCAFDECMRELGIESKERGNGSYQT